MRILFATHNQHKLREIQEILSNFPGSILSAKDLGMTQEVEENGTSFLENAEIKARALYNFAKAQGLLEEDDLVMADDSGLSIEALSFGPGIYSARFLGQDTPYSEKNRRILAMMEESSSKSRMAYFTCAIVAIFADGKVLQTEARCTGEIAKEPGGEEGVGYDPIFYLPEYRKTAAELSREEKNKISHRGKALRKMERMVLEEQEKRNSSRFSKEDKKAGTGKKNRAEHKVETEHREETALQEQGLPAKGKESGDGDQQLRESGGKSANKKASSREEKILVLSDNHRKLDFVEKVLRLHPDIQMCIHLGDSEGEGDVQALLPKGCESYFVQGNNDFFSYLPKDVEVRIGKERCFLSHGHLYGVNFGLERLAEEARDRNCSMAFFGHTHRPCNKVVNGVHCINPGSISFPRQEDRRPCYSLLFLDQKGNLRVEMHKV